MEKRSRRHRMGMFLGLAAGVLLVGAGCEPLINPPPGGGTTLTQTFRYGPFTIATGAEIMGSPSSGLPRPAGSFGLKGARFDLVDQNGIPYEQHEVHLHHIVMTTTARTDALCPGRPERFTGSGTERTPLTLWGPYTYLVGANDQWGAIYHLMNMNPPNSPPLTVYIQYTLDYQPGANATNSRPVQPLFQDVTGCGGSTFDVPGNGGRELLLQVALLAGNNRRHRRVHGGAPARRWHQQHAEGRQHRHQDLQERRRIPPSG